MLQQIVSSNSRLDSTQTFVNKSKENIRKWKPKSANVGISDVQESELRVLEFRKQVEEELFSIPPETECEMFFENNLSPLTEYNETQIRQ